MPGIVAQVDSLNELNGNIAHVSLAPAVFLNRVPKCGSQFMRNIVRMFAPVENKVVPPAKI